MMQMNLFADMDIEDKHMDAREGGGVGTEWEIRTDIHTLACVKQTASGKPLYSTGSSTQRSGMT